MSTETTLGIGDGPAVTALTLTVLWLVNAVLAVAGLVLAAWAVGTSGGMLSLVAVALCIALGPTALTGALLTRGEGP